MSTGIDFDERLRRSKGRSSRTRVVSAKLTPSEQQELEAAAKSQAKSLSEWAREALLVEARRPKHDPLFTELIATRMLMVNLIKPLIMGKSVSQEWITEAMSAIRKEKRKAAQEVLQQYGPESGGTQ